VNSLNTTKRGENEKIFSTKKEKGIFSELSFDLICKGGGALPLDPEGGKVKVINRGRAFSHKAKAELSNPGKTTCNKGGELKAHLVQGVENFSVTFV